MRLRAFTREMHLRRPFIISAGAQEVAHNAFVRLDSGGHWGLGEGAPSPRVTGQSLEDVLAFITPHAGTLAEMDAGAALWIANGLADAIQTGNVPGGPGAAAIDLALLDLAGKANGYSAREMLGLPLMADLPTSITVSLGPIDDMVREADDHLRDGFQTLKVKLGPEPIGSSRFLRALRDVAPSATIRVDANECWNMRVARMMLPLLERYEVELIEQPFPRDDHEAMAELTRVSSIPIVADEMVQGPGDVEIIGRGGLAHGVNIKLQKVGGLTTGVRLATRARELGLRVMVGCFIESGVGISAGAQMLGVCDWADLDGHVLLRDNPFPGPDLTLGVVSGPVEAGIGHGATDLDMEDPSDPIGDGQPG